MWISHKKICWQAEFSAISAVFHCFCLFCFLNIWFLRRFRGWSSFFLVQCMFVVCMFVYLSSIEIATCAARDTFSHGLQWFRPTGPQGQISKNPGPDQKPRTWRARVKEYPHPTPQGREPLHASNHANSSRFVQPYLHTCVSESPFPGYQARPQPQTHSLPFPSCPALYPYPPCPASIPFYCQLRVANSPRAELIEGRTHRGPKSPTPIAIYMNVMVSSLGVYLCIQ